jgi:hypothetical protein
MGIIFSQNTQITATGSSINIPGSVIQFVDNTATVSTTAGTGAWVNTMSTSITISKSGNQILVEYMMNERNDYSQGSWNLIYHRILANGTQVMASGHNGSASLHIGFYERTFLYTPPGNATGTFTFVSQCLAHQGTAWIGNYNSGSTAHYLRLYEIGR